MKLNKVSLQEKAPQPNNLMSSDDMNWGADSQVDYQNFLNNDKDWDEALKSCNTDEDYNNLIREWASSNLKNYQPSQNIDDMLVNWVQSFGTFSENKNPFVAFIKGIQKKGITPNESTLISINNAYANDQLSNKDLYPNTMHPILTKKKFYSSSPEDQEFFLDTYDFLSNESNQKKIKSAISYVSGSMQEDLKIGKNVLDKNSNGNTIRDTIMFVNGNPNGELRNANSIENILTQISKSEGWSQASKSYDGEKELKSNQLKRLETELKRLNKDDLAILIKSLSGEY